MTEKIKELQAVHMVRFFGSRNDFAAGQRGTKSIWREGDSVYIQGLDRTVAIPWSQVAAAEMVAQLSGDEVGIERVSKNGPRETVIDDGYITEPLKKRRGRPKKEAGDE